MMKTFRCARALAAAATLLTLALSPAYAGSVSNLEREKSWADQIVDYLVVGEVVWLQAGGVKFLALHTKAAEGKARNEGVILLHGRGVHPAWGFIDTLRGDLADAGWLTLSIQLPILDLDVPLAEYQKTFPEAFKRIDAAVEWLRKRGVKKVSLVGHSSGAMTAVAYAAERPKAPLDGVGAIGLTTEPRGGPYMQPIELLGRVKVPVLDIYGANDLPLVVNDAKARAAAAKQAGNKGYMQEKVEGANHFFTDRYDLLRTHLARWLART